MHVGRGAHLEADATIAHEGGEAAQAHVRFGTDIDVVDDANAVTEALGVAPLQRLPDRWQTERFAGVDREVEVRVVDELEGVEVAGRRETFLRSGDVEPDNSAVAVSDRELGDLYRPSELAHRSHD